MASVRECSLAEGDARYADQPEARDLRAGDRIAARFPARGESAGGWLVGWYTTDPEGVGTRSGRSVFGMLSLATRVVRVSEG